MERECPVEDATFGRRETHTCIIAWCDRACVFVCACARVYVCLCLHAYGQGVLMFRGGRGRVQTCVT